ncbi:MAG: lipoprotein-releasing ABC transporter permease subunit [Desulfobacterales bacterium]|nr:lipoprotein-releasing ABC transporter permease subunit [Desulfobacterales bacterium]
MRFEWFIGGRYLRARRKQAFISLITILSTAGVAVGVMALIVVIAVMAGAQSEFRSRILGVQSHAVLMRYGGEFAEYRQVIEQLKGEADVVATRPFILTQVMLRSPTGISGAVLKGVAPPTEIERNIQGIGEALEILYATAPENTDQRGGAPVVLGKELGRKLGVARGDTLYVISFRGVVSPMGHVPSMKRFHVAGFFESGMYQFDEAYAFVRLKDAQRILKLGDTVSGIEIRVDDIYQADQIAKRLGARLGFPYRIQDWMQMNANLFYALRLEKVAMFVILTLIVLVAAFNIASTLIMMVMEKTKDIAILKAMGATNRHIMRIFVIKGMMIGISGTLLGVGLGTLLCAVLKRYPIIQLPGDVYYFTSLPVQMQATDVITIALAAIGICFLATLYPARQAARLNPVDAIRYG